MINFSRISAIISRHLIPTFRDPIRMIDMVYYPLVDIVLFGFLAVWAHDKPMHSSQFISAFFTCIACWYLVYRSALEISRNLLIEIWDYHLVNLLAGPLSVLELLISLMIIGLIQATITFLYSSLVIWLVFACNIFVFYPLILPYLPLFIIFGWVLGIFTAALIFYFGKSVEFVAWAVPWLFAMLSGAFYSLTLFPLWAQKISACIPASYFFAGLREAIQSGSLPLSGLAMGGLLLAFYFLATFLFLFWMVAKRKEKGYYSMG